MILDTTFLIDLMRSDSHALNKLLELEERNEELNITLPTVFELWSGIGQTHRSEKEKRAVEKVLENRKMLDFTLETAKLAGFIDGTLVKEGVTIGQVDAMIAATALEVRQTILTRNLKHFSRIKGLALETY